MSGFDTTQRFFRPDDVGRVRRNQRRIDLHRFAVIGRNLLVVSAVAVIGLAIYHRTQSGPRFAVKTIELAGIVHTPREAVDGVTRRYVGLNLFQLDIARVRHDLGDVAWIKRIDVEKKLPDTLRIQIVERKPVALMRVGQRLQYVDEDGVALAEVSPAVGDADLPLIVDAGTTGGSELQRCVVLIRDLRLRDPLVYSRLSEVRPIAPKGFALFDRELGAFVYANAGDVSAKWRSLYAIVAAERLGPGAIEYADLRFADRIVVKPRKPITTAAAPVRTMAPSAITN